jgi:EmrB/QacA subfamily drug resistance transporter
MPGIRRLRGDPWAVLVIVCLGYFMTLLGSTSLSIAVPRIQSEMDAGLNEVLWMVGAYVLAMAILMITAGRLGDLFGPRTIFVIGMTVFTVTSALCGLADTPWQLIACRFLQGAGAALVIPQTLTLMTLTFPVERRGVASSVWGIAAALGAIAGPTLGGVIVAHAGWRWIFYINLPVGVIATVLALVIVPDRRTARSRWLDPHSVMLAAPALGAITFGLLEGRHYDWDPMIFVVVAAGLALLVAFAVRQRLARDPLIPPRLFTSRTFTLMSVVMAVVSMAMMSISLSMTIYLQSVLGLSAAQAGVTLAPWAAGMLMAFPFVGRLVDRFGPQFVLVSGLLLYACSLAAIGLLAQPDADQVALMIPLTVAGLSQSAVFAPATVVAMRDVDADLVGAGSGVFNTIRQIGTLLSVAVLGSVMAARFDTGVADRARDSARELSSEYRETFVHAVTDAATRGDGPRITLSPDLPAGVVQEMQEIAKSVHGHAFSGAAGFTLLICAAGVAIAGVACVVLRRAPARRAVEVRQGGQP